MKIWQIKASKGTHKINHAMLRTMLEIVIQIQTYSTEFNLKTNSPFAGEEYVKASAL